GKTMRSKQQSSAINAGLISAALAATLASAGIAAAQTYPSRPITMVVPFPAGGPLDSSARIIAERMRVSLGQPIVVENVVGASGSIGAGRVARAAPDGYAFVVGGTPTHLINPPGLAPTYDVVQGFPPIRTTT